MIDRMMNGMGGMMWGMGLMRVRTLLNMRIEALGAPRASIS